MRALLFVILFGTSFFSTAAITVSDYHAIVLDCVSVNPHYFGLGDPLVVTVVQYEESEADNLTIHFTYKNGIASAGVKLEGEDFFGSGLFTKEISLKKNDSEKYIFNSVDSKDGALTIKDVEVSCQ